MLRNKLLVLVFALLVSGVAAAGKVSTYSDIELKGKLYDGQPFLLTIGTERNDIEDPRASYVGYDGQATVRILKKFSLVVSGKEMVLPKRAYHDLVDAHVFANGSPYLMQNGNTIVLHLSGSDGVASYEAEFHFQNGKLVRRIIEDMNSKGELVKTSTNY